jgi:hypothetical protein
LKSLGARPASAAAAEPRSAIRHDYVAINYIAIICLRRARAWLKKAYLKN